VGSSFSNRKTPLLVPPRMMVHENRVLFCTGAPRFSPETSRFRDENRTCRRGRQGPMRSQKSLKPTILNGFIKKPQRQGAQHLRNQASFGVCRNDIRRMFGAAYGLFTEPSRVHGDRLNTYYKKFKTRVIGVA
jgi:hypothetical protein